MLYRPSDLEPEQLSAFEGYAESVRQRMLDEVEAMLDGLDPALAQFLYETAFRANESLPQRDQRPQLRPAVLALAQADAVELGEERSDALLGFTVASQEYFDVVDDAVDGDVAGGTDAEALLAAQLLLVLALRRLSELDAATPRYWVDSVAELVRAPFTETQEEPSAALYESMLDRQSELLGFVTGVAAVAAGLPDDDVAHAARVGRLVYRHFALVHDVEQYERGDDGDGDWNAAALFGHDGTQQRLVDVRSDVERATRRYPDPAGTRIRNLVALDVEEWRRLLTDA